jgi:hypothetical protein
MRMEEAGARAVRGRTGLSRRFEDRTVWLSPPGTIHSSARQKNLQNITV